jgi:hypothetical protein
LGLTAHQQSTARFNGNLRPLVGQNLIADRKGGTAEKGGIGERILHPSHGDPCHGAVNGNNANITKNWQVFNGKFSWIEVADFIALVD